MRNVSLARWRGAAALACAAAVALPVAGCGDDGDSAAQQGATDYSWANESPRVFAQRLAKLLETSHRGACDQLDAVSARSMTGFSCPPERSLARSMAKFRVLGSEEYGTGAIVDYRSGAVTDSAAVVLVVAPNREWAVGRFGVFAEPSVDTGDERSRAGFAAAVDDYLRATRERDCKALARVELDSSGSDRPACSERLAQTRQLARLLKSNPDAEPVYEGGNATFGFHRLELAKPRRSSLTIATMRAAESGAGRSDRGDGQDPAGASGGADDRTPPRALVLGALASPTAANQRKAVRVLERRERQQRDLQ